MTNDKFTFSGDSGAEEQVVTAKTELTHRAAM
jgi:hypothetical protein